MFRFQSPVLDVGLLSDGVRAAESSDVDVGVEQRHGQLRDDEVGEEPGVQSGYHDVRGHAGVQRGRSCGPDEPDDGDEQVPVSALSEELRAEEHVSESPEVTW